jgi:hypothetical protein
MFLLIEFVLKPPHITGECMSTTISANKECSLEFIITQGSWNADHLNLTKSVQDKF